MANRGSADEAARVLSSVPCFAPLEAGVIESLARIASRHNYAAGQVVFLEGEPCAGLHVVESGWLKGTKTSRAGREQTVRIVGPGEALNEIGLLAACPNVVTVLALEPAQVWLVDRDPLLEIIAEQASLATILARNMAQRVFHLMGLIEDLSLRSVEARLARLLLTQSSGELPRRSWATQAEMAARLGTVPDVLNRALRGLARQGLIRVSRTRILILDLKGLEKKGAVDK